MVTNPHAMLSLSSIRTSFHYLPATNQGDASSVRKATNPPRIVKMLPNVPTARARTWQIVANVHPGTVSSKSSVLSILHLKPNMDIWITNIYGLQVSNVDIQQSPLLFSPILLVVAFNIPNVTEQTSRNRVDRSPYVQLASGGHDESAT